MKDITVLFEYQKFNPNRELEKKIDEIHSSFFSGGDMLDDDILDVSAAGEADGGRENRIGKAALNE